MTPTDGKKCILTFRKEEFHTKSAFGGGSCAGGVNKGARTHTDVAVRVSEQSRDDLIKRIISGAGGYNAWTRLYIYTDLTLKSSHPLFIPRFPIFNAAAEDFCRIPDHFRP